MKKIVTAQEIFDSLVNVDKIQSLAGFIKFHMGDVSITVKRKDVVGNILQEWLENDYTIGELWQKNILGGRLSG